MFEVFQISKETSLKGVKANKIRCFKKENKVHTSLMKKERSYNHYRKFRLKLLKNK